MRSLRASVIRLAYENPSLRPHLLPLLKEADSEHEAGRPWGGKGYKSRAKDYDDPSPGPGTPPCTPLGDDPNPDCYSSHPGSPAAGSNGSAQRKKYNDWYRKNVEGV